MMNNIMPLAGILGIGGSLLAIFTGILGKLILALLVFFGGKYCIEKVKQLIVRRRGFGQMDPTVRSFLLNAIHIGLYAVLLISIISILGVPMASVITVLASAGVAVGLALQGALSNLAGGIMLLVFRPFNVGNYISASGVEGTVREISLIYTVLISPDNKRITIPNGSLMNANVINYSAEPERRVDLVFRCAKGEDVEKVKEILLSVMNRNERVLRSPAPFAGLTGESIEAMEFSARAWTASSEYWTVYSELIEGITEELGKAGIEAPATRVITK